MEAQVILYLEALGVQITTGDVLLGMVIREVEQRLKNLSNQAELPEGLEPMAIRMVVGEIGRAHV